MTNVIEPGPTKPPVMPMVKLDDVYLTLQSRAGPVNILRGVNLVIEPGQSLGIVGPSGSGKSTMLSVIAGLDRADSGRIMVAGRDFKNMDEDDLAIFRRNTIGIVFQAFHLIPAMTALENVAVPLELSGISNALELARRELIAVGLEGRLDHYPAQLSGGEQQRVALARAFATRPALILADEPTGNLDSTTSSKIIELIFESRARNNTTLMLITHDLVAASHCDKVVQLSDGKIVIKEGPYEHSII